MGRVRLLVSDFVLSFMWVWPGVLIRVFIFKHLALPHTPLVEVLKTALSVVNMFLFAFLVKATRGGAYNPLTVLADAITGNFNNFLYCVAARIPTQVVGSIVGVKLLIDTIPEVGLGPSLNVDIHQGALTEGLLTFAIVTISLGLATKVRENFLMKTWISSLSKLALHILGSDLTGGCMNPASVMGWAYARGDHITKEHFLVYWLAPIEGTILAVWTFKLLVRPVKEDKTSSKRTRQTTQNQQDKEEEVRNAKEKGLDAPKEQIAPLISAKPKQTLPTLFLLGLLLAEAKFASVSLGRDETTFISLTAKAEFPSVPWKNAGGDS
ncbi:putative aquaporin SIP2-1, partial [Mucuna pruriens]